MKYLLLGKDGQLGKALLSHLITQKKDFAAYDMYDFDITDYHNANKTIIEENPDILINATAYNNVDAAESESDTAYAVNAFALKNLAEVCNDIKCKIIHYSSDYVFDGTKGSPYIETDKPNPLSEYGKSKLKGEEYIRAMANSYLIFRLSWLYGNGKQNFIYKMQQWANQNDTLKIVDDEVSVPTSVCTVRDITFDCIDKSITGLYHLTNSGFASRYEWALEIKKILGLKNEIIPLSINDFDLPAKRPVFSAMSNELIQNKLNNRIDYWQESLKKFFNI